MGWNKRILTCVKKCVLFRLVCMISLLFVVLFPISERVYAESPQEDVLDTYFECVNNLDPDGILELTGNYFDDTNRVKTNFAFFISQLHFYPGTMWLSTVLRTENTVSISYLRGLGFKGSFEEMKESFFDDTDGERSVLFDTFKASYELIDLVNADKCKKIQHREGLKVVDITDLREFLKESTEWKKIDEVSVAKIKVYWEYNELPYGIDKSLCYLKDFPDDEFLVSECESGIEELDNMEYNVILYKVADKWYLLDENILGKLQPWIIEM